MRLKSAPPSLYEFTQFVMAEAYQRGYDFNEEPNFLSGATRFLLQSNQLSPQWRNHLAAFERFGHLRPAQLLRWKKDLTDKKPFSRVPFALDSFDLFLFRYLQAKGVEANPLASNPFLVSSVLRSMEKTSEKFLQSQSSYFGTTLKNTTHLARRTACESLAQSILARRALVQPYDISPVLTGFVKVTLKVLSMTYYMDHRATYTQQLKSDSMFWRMHLIAQLKSHLPDILDLSDYKYELPAIFEAHQKELEQREQGLDYAALMPFEQVAANILDNPQSTAIQAVLVQAQKDLDALNLKMLDQLLPSLILMLPLSIYESFEPKHLKQAYTELWAQEKSLHRGLHSVVLALPLLTSDIGDKCYLNGTQEEKRAHQQQELEKAKLWGDPDITACFLRPEILAPHKDQEDLTTDFWKLLRLVKELLEGSSVAPEGVVKTLAHAFLERMRQPEFSAQISAYMHQHMARLNSEVDLAQIFGVNILNSTFQCLRNKNSADLPASVREVLSHFAPLIQTTLRALEETGEIDELKEAELLQVYYAQANSAAEVTLIQDVQPVKTTLKKPRI